jgi:hypothetical protein
MATEGGGAVTAYCGAGGTMARKLRVTDGAALKFLSPG